jgi:UPF0148 protein
MDEEEILKRITGLLEQGCTMLAQHHNCGAPLFRCKGKILCPVCSFETEKPIDIQANEVETAVSTQAKASKDAHEGEILSSAMPVIDKMKELKENGRARLRSQDEESITSGHDLMELTTISQQEINSLLRKALLYELKELSDNIGKERDLSRLRAMLDCIEAALRILSVLNDVES